MVVKYTGSKVKISDKIGKDDLYLLHHGEVCCDIQCRDRNAPVVVVLESPWHLEHFLQRPATGWTGAILCAIFEEVRKKLPPSFKNIASSFCTQEAALLNVAKDYLPFKKDAQTSKRLAAKEFIDSQPDEYKTMVEGFGERIRKNIDISSVRVALLMGQLSWGTRDCFCPSSKVIELYHPSYIGRNKKFGGDVVARARFVAAYILHCLKHTERNDSIDGFNNYLKLNDKLHFI